MENPFLVGFILLAFVAGVGYGTERYSAWAKPAAVLATVALTGAALLQFLR